MKKIFSLITATALIASTASAQFISFSSGDSLTGESLSGNTGFAGWNNLSPSAVETPGNYGAFGSTAAWADVLESQTGLLSADLFKTGGGGHLYSSDGVPAAIYQGTYAPSGPGGTFQITSNALADIETFIFQIEVSTANDLAFNPGGQPVLKFGSSTLSADFTTIFSSVDNSTGQGSSELQKWAFQWDLSELSIAEDTELTIEWTGVNHSFIHALQIDQGDTFAQVVPEPSTYALIFGAAALGICLYRRKKS